METTDLANLKEQFFVSIQERFISIASERKFKSEVGFAIQIIKKNKMLQQCDAQSVLEAVLNVSQTGLSLNPVYSYAYLIPRYDRDKKRWLCCLDPGYQGLIKLITDAGIVKSLEVNLVYEGDDCVVDLASDNKIVKHVPYMFNGKEKGKIIGGYSLGILSEGKHIEIMTRADIEAIREYSESWKYAEKKGIKSSPWHNNEDEMFRKTIVRRHFKYLPKSGNDKIERALELDNEDFDFPASFGQGSMIESLLMSASIPEKIEREIYQSLHNNDFTQKRAQKCIEYLESNQVNHIDAGKTYNQGDIKKRLDWIKDEAQLKKADDENIND